MIETRTSLHIIKQVLVSYRPTTTVGFGLVHALSWIGLVALTTPWLRTTVSNLPDKLDARLWRAGIADCEFG
ncbi:hypothetical protein TIFTF001_038709 [Ficus carica]|uniref:Uncharacterized protein n=1 Tax=Ficus carica TaxID=3494 RepID=A0AA88JA80_FICCA|nr:hypothetical protein TIFTF001_038709 [Ficus carica]